MNILCFIAFLTCSSLDALPPINLFRPSDRFLMPEPIMCCWGSQLSIGYEGAFHIRGFRDDEDFLLQACINESTGIEKKTNVLDIYQTRQNVLAGLKGLGCETSESQLAQLFNINDENGTQGIYCPTGCLHVPLNLLISQRFYFNYGLSLGLHLPVYQMKLDNIRWKSINTCTTSEQLLEPDFLEHVRTLSSLNLRGWNRTGIGDFVAQLTWMKDFPQTKAFLDNVRVQMRLGLNFPTGKLQDEDLLFAFPFGNDGSWGLQWAGGLDLTFCSMLRGGVDVEFLYLFGNTRCRRVKTVCNQTDLMFLASVPAFREFGLGQQYNLYLESCNFWRGLSCKLNYQFLKRNDDRLDVCSDRLDTIVINSAESLQDWTAHSLIFGARYDFCKDYPEARVQPSLIAWVKWGFNGKRALLANTLGLQLSLAF